MALNAKLADFRKEYAETTTRNLQHSRPAHITSSSNPTRTGTPKPTDAKRTHDDAFSTSDNTRTGTKASEAAIASRQTGSELMTQVWTAIKYLKEKSPQPIPFDNLISYLSLPNDAAKNIPLIKRALRESERATYIPKTTSPSHGGREREKESFKYAPLYPVTNAEELKSYVATLATRSASGIPVKDLKDGWPDCAPALEDLEKEGFVLITRWKKDNTPRTIYPDSPSYHILTASATTTTAAAGASGGGGGGGHPQKASPDFIDVWSKTKLPAAEGELRLELEKAGLTPTSAVREVRKGADGAKRKEKRRGGLRKGGKTTNAHMLHILKDYSKR